MQNYYVILRFLNCIYELDNFMQNYRENFSFFAFIYELVNILYISVSQKSFTISESNMYCESSYYV